MKRLTVNPRLAMQRMAEHVGAQVTKVPGGYNLINSDGWRDRPRNAKKTLAKLVMIAQFRVVSGGQGMSRSEVRDVIRLSRVTPRGTVAHEEEAIREVLSV